VTAVHARFDAFGSYGFLAVRRPGALPDALALARQVVADVDATCSRFREDSDLSRANRRPGRWVDVDPLLVAAVGVAREAAVESAGLVSPLLGRPLVQLGYDRDLAELHELRDAPDQPVDIPDVDAWRAIGLDRAGRIRVPEGTALDLGSTGKAFAADLVATAVERELAVPAVVSLGGDVRVAAPDGRPWPVAVSEQPGAPATTVWLDHGGLATSSTRVRRWSRAGDTRHHLLDPRTGRPAPEVWRTVTATGPTCVAANTASTAAVVLGADAPRWLAAHSVTARLVDATGRPTYLGGWPADSREAS
jgi:thiamine biosynthesis lipoprotein